MDDYELNYKPSIQLFYENVIYFNEQRLNISLFKYN